MPSTTRTTPRRRRGYTALAVGLAGATVLGGVSGVSASSHREAPLIMGDPLADGTDVYAFMSPDKPGFVTLIANWVPAQDPAAGPNYFRFGEDVKYAIHVDSDGDAVEDVTYEWRFRNDIQDKTTFLYASADAENAQIERLDDPDYNFRQVMDVFVVRNGQRTQLVNGQIVPPSNVGPIATPNYEDLAAEGIRPLTQGLETGGQVFAGQRDDAFFGDIGAIFDQGQLRPALEAYKPAPRPNEAGRDFFAGYNVHTTSIQVPVAAVAESAAQPVIGVWSTASRPKVRVFNRNNGAQPVNRGRFVQVSRLGNPLVNEVVIPLGLKDAFNSLAPKDDAATLSVPDTGNGITIPLVQDPELGKRIEQLYGIDVPNAPRNDLVGVFLTGAGATAVEGVQPAEVLRLNTSTAPGDVSWPNGRKLSDDVIDTALSAVGGTALGDGVAGNDATFLTSFPYQATPWQGFAENNETRTKSQG